VVVVALTGTMLELTDTVAEAPDASIPVAGVLSVKPELAGRDALHVIMPVLLFLMVTVSDPPDVPHATMLKFTSAGVTLTTDPSVPVPDRLTFVPGMG
jgi:hypothetical protein